MNEQLPPQSTHKFLESKNKKSHSCSWLLKVVIITFISLFVILGLYAWKSYQDLVTEHDEALRMQKQAEILLKQAEISLKAHEDTSKKLEKAGDESK